MIDRTTKLRWRRRFRRSKRQVEELGTQAEEGLERHFFKRLSRLTKVRRFIAAWVLLFILLIFGVLYQARALGTYYLEDKPVPGGIFTEGVLGNFTNANPIYAAGSVDNSVARLVFAGLFKNNQQNQLVGDLAESWTVDEKETTYTVKLKPNLRWQDGEPLDSQDIVFTYKMIQNPDAKSPLAPSWQGIDVTAVDDRTVNFKLPNVLSAFPLSMVNGIIPEHLLKDIPATQLRSSPFNTVNPIGAGPFRWEAIEVVGVSPEDREQRIGLAPNELYHAGPPKLDQFIIRSFPDEERLTTAFKSQELNAASGFSVVPDQLKTDTDVQDNNILLTSGVYVFLKNSNEILSDVRVRKAFVAGTNTNQILERVGRSVRPLKSPLLPSHVGYDPSVLQQTGNIAEANKLLDEAGWVKGPDGFRVKDGKTLRFNLVSQRNTIYDYVAQTLKEQWTPLGADVVVRLQDSDELQNTLAFHNYDALLYGIALGPDPDVFAFWHSTQADLRAANRLNFSEYKSAPADKALEAGRTRNDATLRAVKYKPFLEAWRNDAPAVALFQPRYLYLVRGNLANFEPVSLNSATDRYANVENWLIRQSPQPIIK